MVISFQFHFSFIHLAIQCTQPLVPLNGRIDGHSGHSNMAQRKYPVGALVTFSCTEGHLLVGEASIVCTETGLWSHQTPFCKYHFIFHLLSLHHLMFILNKNHYVQMYSFPLSNKQVVLNVHTPVIHPMDFWLH